MNIRFEFLTAVTLQIVKFYVFPESPTRLQSATLQYRLTVIGLHILRYKTFYSCNMDKIKNDNESHMNIYIFENPFT